MGYILEHKFVAGIITVVILGALWYGLSNSGAQAPILQTEAPVSESDKELVSTLLTLRAVQLNGTIFQDPVFQSLQDFTTEITPEPVGRPNPFAPLQIKATTNSTQRATIFGKQKR
jgi:hypothetical protein